MREKPENIHKNCPSCGAPVVSEICAYCGTATGLDTASADMEYPVLECKEATLSFWSVGFPAIFAAAFGIPGLALVTISILGHGNAIMLLAGTPFLLIGIGALSIVLRTVLRYGKLKKHGEVIQGTVYGYLDDNVLINGQPAKIVKILVPTAHGPRIILYQLGNTIKMYGVNDKVDIMVYKNYFLICKNEETVRW